MKTMKVKIVSAKEFANRYRASIWYRHLIGSILTVKVLPNYGVHTGEPLHQVCGLNTFQTVYARDFVVVLDCKKVRGVRKVRCL
jgi:hypothetical protein